MKDWCIERLTSLEQFSDLQENWNELLREAQVANVFMRHDWLHQWWQVYGSRGCALWILIATSSRGIEGIAPLVLERHANGLRKLVFMGAGDVAPNHLDFLLRVDGRVAITERFCNYLWEHRSEWDVLELKSFAENSPTFTQLHAYFDAKGLKLAAGLHVRCPYVVLPNSFAEYLQSIGARTRKNVRRLGRKFMRENPNIQYGRVRTSQELDAAFEALVQLHQARWMRRAQPGAFAHDDFVTFHHAAAHSAFTNDTLRFYYIKHAGAYIALEYCYRIGNRVMSYLSGFDEHWGEYSVGMLLQAYAIEQAIGEGMGEYDFLQGESGYKMHWAKEVRRNDYLLLFAPNWRGQWQWLNMRFNHIAQKLKHKLFSHEFRQAVKRVLRRT